MSVALIGYGLLFSLGVSLTFWLYFFIVALLIGIVVAVIEWINLVRKKGQE